MQALLLTEIAFLSKVSMDSKPPYFESTPPNLSSKPLWRAGTAEPQSAFWSEKLDLASIFLKKQSEKMRPPTMEKMSFGDEGSDILRRNSQREIDYAPQKKKAWAGALVAGLVLGGPVGMAMAGVAHFVSGGWLGRLAAQGFLSLGSTALHLASGKPGNPTMGEARASGSSSSSYNELNQQNQRTRDFASAKLAPPMVAAKHSLPPAVSMAKIEEAPPKKKEESDKKGDYAGNADYSKDISTASDLPPGYIAPMPIEKIKAKMPAFCPPRSNVATEKKIRGPSRGMDI